MNKTLLFLLFVSSLSTTAAQNVQLCGTQPVLFTQLTATRGIETSDARQQAWLYWQIAQSGNLAFSLHPLASNDDLDFVLYRKNGVTWQAVRRMESGELMGAAAEQSRACIGVCGLHPSATDETEPRGCSALQDNFLAPVEAITGEEYALLVSNYKSTNGFWWNYQGTASFVANNAATHYGATLGLSDKVFNSPTNTQSTTLDLTALRSNEQANLLLKKGVSAARLFTNITLAGCSTQSTAVATNTAAPNTVALNSIGEPSPNPTRDKIQIPLSLVSSTDLSIAVYQNNGACIYQQEMHFEKGKNLLELDSQQWQSATYLIVIKNNQVITTKTIIKQ
jgi:Secretion system C-terminal sorting domain